MGLFTKTETTTLSVQGMTCGHCQQRVRDALEAVPGVKSATVDLDAGRATVKRKAGEAPVGDLVSAVEDAGYTATAP